jgi:DNA-binding Lrp family transcriptional regulator
MTLTPLETRLLNEHQRRFPLVREPYAAIARHLGVDADWVVETLRSRIGDGTVSRVGAVFRPGAIGVSTLAAMAVPPDEIERVAACVSARPEVNHNYQREHRFNLWFVVTAVDRLRLDAALAAIARETGVASVALPLVRDYAIDLGFDFVRGERHACAAAAVADGRARTAGLSPADARLVAALEDGLPLVVRPYAAVAQRADLAELYVMSRIADWVRSGVVRRFGVVVRHRALGYTANAMCVWDVADDAVDAIGAALAREQGVTLCYRRARAADWPYNLFCMIHGRDRSRVVAAIDAIAHAHRLGGYPSAVLFSTRAFKQCGARYSGAAREAPPLAA